MKKLSLKEKKRLKQILERDSLISSDDPARRKSLLRELEVWEECDGKFDMKAVTSEFVTLLTTTLEAELNPSGQSMLWRFICNYAEMYGDKLPPADCSFIEGLCSQPGNARPELEMRVSHSMTGKAPPDKSIIIDFDLGEMELAAVTALQPLTGAFGFFLSVPCEHICRSYIIERLSKLIERKCERNVERYNVYVKADDIDDPTGPLKRLEQELNSPISDWFNDNSPVALMVCVWSYDAMPIETIVSQCWKKILESYGDSLIQKAHTLVITWVSVNGAAVHLDAARFQTLALPEQFNGDEIRAHFKQRLKNVGLDDLSIQWVLDKIMEYGGHVRQTYGMMGDTIKQIQRGVFSNAT